MNSHARSPSDAKLSFQADGNVWRLTSVPTEGSHNLRKSSAYLPTKKIRQENRCIKRIHSGSAALEQSRQHHTRRGIINISIRDARSNQPDAAHNRDYRQWRRASMGCCSARSMVSSADGVRPAVVVVGTRETTTSRRFIRGLYSSQCVRCGENWSKYNVSKLDVFVFSVQLLELLSINNVDTFSVISNIPYLLVHFCSYIFFEICMDRQLW